MKYIVTIDEDGKEDLFTFPNNIDHDCMAEMIERIRNQMHGNWRRVRRIPVSAGFVNASGICMGESETLSLKSRGKIDTELLRQQR